MNDEGEPAPPRISRTIRGLLRAATAVDTLLDRIRHELVDGFLPQKDALLEMLAFDDVTTRIEAFIYEDVLDFRQWDSIDQTFSAMALSLAQLEDALVGLRRAVTWSSRFSGFNWWLQKRQQDLDVGGYLVIAGPGNCHDFHIEHISSVSKTFEQANLYLKLPQQRIFDLRTIRILTVPQSDGASARWHPISLGHELAHLRFDTGWVLEWLANQEPEQAPYSAKLVIELARREAESPAPTRESWFQAVCSWLVETACDASLLAFYGERGVAALAAYLSTHSVPADGPDHPAPELRLTAIAAQNTDELVAFFSDVGDDATLGRHRRNSYCELALGVRSHVLTELGHQDADDERRGTVEASATQALDLDVTPCSGTWDLDWVRAHPENIEAGLVGALWASKEVDLTITRPDAAARAVAERRVEHSVDFLQFLHRFEKRRLEPANQSLQPGPNEFPTNVLFISRQGIKSNIDLDSSADPDDPGNKPEVQTDRITSSGPESGGTPIGVAAHDVRLGRHFIVFRRNQIATLNALDADQQTRQVQEEVEIGWGDTFVLHPAEMVLAVTLESMILTTDCTAQVLSRSSLGRMGLLSATAVQVQPGFRGCLTLELVNLASVPLKLSPGQRVAQIVPTYAVGAPSPYNGKYQDQDWKPKFSAAVNDWEMPILKRLGYEQLQPILKEVDAN